MAINGISVWVCKVQHIASSGVAFLLPYNVHQQQQHINLVPRKSAICLKRHLDDAKVVVAFAKLHPPVGPLAWQSTQLDLAGVGSLPPGVLSTMHTQLDSTAQLDLQPAGTLTPEKPLPSALLKAEIPEQMAGNEVFPEDVHIAAAP